MQRFALCLAALAVPLLSPVGAAGPSLDDRVRTLLAATGEGPDADRVNASRELDETIRREGVGSVPVADVVGGLTAAAANPVAEVRAHALAALGRLRNPAALPVLTKALDDPDAGVRSTAASGLGDLGPAAKATAPRLAAMVAADRIGEHGYEPLAKLLGGDAAPVILASVKRGRAGPNAMSRAIHALAELGDLRAAEFMAGVLEDRDRLDRVFAALYFAKLGDGPSVARLRKCLTQLPRPGDDEYGPNSTKLKVSTEVRQVAVEALGRRKDPKSFDRILKMVEDDPSVRVRVAAAAALGGYADPRAVPALARVLAWNGEGRDVSSEGLRDGEYQETVVAALGRVGTADALAAVYGQLKGGPAKAQSQRYWTPRAGPADKKAKLLDTFVKLYDADPAPPDVAAYILFVLLYDKDAKKPTTDQQAAAEAEFRKAVADPARFGPAADLSEKGKYEVRTTLSFPRDGFASAEFYFRYAALRRGFGHGYTVLYRKAGGTWRPVGKALEVIE